MTTRLKILSGLLVLSIIYAVMNFISDNRDLNSSKSIPNQAANKQINKITTTKVETDDIVIVNNYKPFKPAPENIAKKVTDWGSDPFRTNIKEVDKSKSNIYKPVDKINDNLSSQGFNRINIESVALIGEMAIVIINGQRYREGDKIQNLIIDKIESQHVTFIMGNTKIIKNVGE